MTESNGFFVRFDRRSSRLVVIEGHTSPPGIGWNPANFGDLSLDERQVLLGKHSPARKCTRVAIDPDSEVGDL